MPSTQPFEADKNVRPTDQRQAEFDMRSTILSLAVLFFPAFAQAQMTLTGRLLWPPVDGAAKEVGIGHVLVFGSQAGADKQPLAFRSWETNPVGWYRLSGPAGRYTLLFAQPGNFMRPAILNNIYTRDGEKINLSRSVRAPWDEACMDDSAWDRTAAHEYFQPFLARGASITQVGFKLAHDGVDGPGPLAQDLVLSIHEVVENAPPAKWARVGPEMPVVDVDCGGGKNYSYSAGFDSGEVPTTPGRKYAVRLAAKSPAGKFQPFWHRIAQGEKYLPAQRAKAGAADSPVAYEDTGNHLWMTIASDSDGLLIPYNKRVHKEFNQLTKFARVWSQTYIARGKSLAGVVLYAATSGVQPSMNQQRLRIIVVDEETGNVVGAAKIAIGNGLYTGDASWGTFGAVYEPDEVPLAPGHTYRLHFESIETPHNLGLGTFVNTKGMKSDGRPGFNPYRKHPLDIDKAGHAFLNGTEAQDFSLDMQVIEYEQQLHGHENSTRGAELIKFGNFEKGEDWSSAWKPPGGKAQNATIEPETTASGGTALRMSSREKTFDAVVVQRVAGLSPTQTYRLVAMACANQLPSDQCRTLIGIDKTGQTDDADAATVEWTVLPAITGRFDGYAPAPVRPAADAISVFLRLRVTDPPAPAPVAEFQRISMRQVDTHPPQRP
jgi:hypothetical protein